MIWLFLFCRTLDDCINCTCNDSMSAKNLLSVLILTTFFYSCQTLKSRKWTSDDLIISDQATIDSLHFAKSISPAQAKEDIDFLVFALSNGYGGRSYAPQDSFTKAITALKSISNITTLPDFHDQIDTALFLIPDNHLMAYYKGHVSQKRHDYEQTLTGKAGENNITNPEKVWETRIDRVGKKKILYISIVRFPDSESPIWKGFISAVSSKMKSADSIVFDLRGNSGGDDTIAMELAEVLFGHRFEHAIKHQYRSQTPETLALAINRSKLDIINLRYDQQPIPDYLTADLTKAKELYSKALAGQLPTEFIRNNKGGGNRTDPITGYKKPIYILMDRSCGSSCEFAIAAFEWHKHVKKIGENTSGTFHFSNAGLAVLPNSKIKVIIPAQHSEYYDHRFIERLGLTPDIVASPGDDAYAMAKKIISSH